MFMAFAGVAASGTAYVRSSAPVRPASPWSLAERAGALRIDRPLPQAVQKPATFSVRDRHAVLKVRQPTGPVLLKCPLRADVPEQYLRFATAGAAQQCEAQAVDEVGDVLVYEVSGRVSPLCPGQFATLTEQQLHDALFLPALQAARPRDEPAPASVLQPGSPETAADLRAFFDRHPRGICLFMRGIDVERPREAEMAAQTLAFPVFAPFDPRLPSRATPLLRSLQRASFDEETMAALFGRCEPGGEKACKLKRDRMAAQLCASVGKLQTPLTNLAADEIPYHVGASGPFHLADYDALHVTLESSAEVPKAKGTRSRLLIRYQPLWPESVAEKRLQCLQQPGICLFRALWNLDAPARPEPGEDGFESLVALFARRDGGTRCVRRLFNALASASEDRLLELQRDLREPVAAGENRAPCDARARALAGLVPRNDDGLSPACEDPSPAQPFGEIRDANRRPLSRGYVHEEPWAP